MFYTLFTHPKSVLRQAPFYAGLQVWGLCSSPATSIPQILENQGLEDFF